MSLAGSLDSLKELDKFSLYETRPNRILHTNLKSLKETQADRKQAEEKCWPKPPQSRSTSKASRWSTIPAGWIRFSASELASYIRRNDRLEEAKQAQPHPSSSRSMARPRAASR